MIDKILKISKINTNPFILPNIIGFLVSRPAFIFPFIVISIFLLLVLSIEKLVVRWTVEKIIMDGTRKLKGKNSFEIPRIHR